MATVFTDTASGESAGYGGFIDAVGGIATVVLAVIALAGTQSLLLLSISTIIFGAALMVQGGTMLTEYSRIIFPSGAAATGTEQFGGTTLSIVFLVGAAGIVLGVLALLGIHAAELTAIAAIAFGSALVLSSNAVSHLHTLHSASMHVAGARTGTEVLAGEMASGSAGIQSLAGLAAIVLGILAVVGVANGVILTLIALLVLGAMIVLTGSTLSGMVMGFMRPWSSATP